MSVIQLTIDETGEAKIDTDQDDLDLIGRILSGTGWEERGSILQDMLENPEQMLQRNIVPDSPERFLASALITTESGGRRTVECMIGGEIKNTACPLAVRVQMAEAMVTVGHHIRLEGNKH